MGQNIFGGRSGRDFARGEPPPPDSHEWVGVALPPGKKPAAKKPGTPVVVATVRETIVVEKKRPFKWLGLGMVGGVIVGFFLGHKTGSVLMAFDIMKGTCCGRSWSRGEFNVRKTLDTVKKQVPWKPLLIGLGVGAGALVLLSGKKGHGLRHRDELPDSLKTTQQIPRESMHDLVYGRRASR